MRTIETTAVVTPEHTITVQLPPDVPPGPCQVVVVVGTAGLPVHRATGQPLVFSNYPVRLATDTTFRREEMYGDDGR
jgi:hypothetical protein